MSVPTNNWSRKTIIFLLSQCIAAGTQLMYALLIVSALRSVGAGIQTPAVNAVLPQLVPEEQLMRYNGINATMQSIVQFAAPAAAGAILTAGTLDKTMLIDIATAAAGIGMLAFLAIPKQTTPTEHVSLREDIKKGVSYAFKNRFLGRLLGLYGLFIFLAVPAGFLCSLLVSRVYGDSYYCLTAVELVGFAGMTVGGVLMGAWGGFKSRTRTLFWGLVAFGMLAIGMGASRSFVLYLALMLLYGIALTMVQTASTTLVQESAAPEMQGRVFGLMGTIYSGFLPVGMAVFGPMADAVPLQWVMIGSGVGLIALALVMRTSKKFYYPSEEEE